MRKALEELIFFGRLEDTVQVGGLQFTLGTLNAAERLEATTSTSATNDPITRVTALKIALLGRSLKKVNNEAIVDSVEGLEVISNLQAPIVDRLFEKYEELQRKQESSLENNEDLKN